MCIRDRGNTRALMEAVDSGQADYDFVAVMACPGGCAGGGGQPIHDNREMASPRGDMPVSYTHLDVYKRQRLRRSRWPV